MLPSHKLPRAARWRDGPVLLAELMAVRTLLVNLFASAIKGSAYTRSPSAQDGPCTPDSIKLQKAEGILANRKDGKDRKDVGGHTVPPLRFPRRSLFWLVLLFGCVPRASRSFPCLPPSRPDWSPFAAVLFAGICRKVPRSRASAVNDSDCLALQDSSRFGAVSPHPNADVQAPRKVELSVFASSPTAQEDGWTERPRRALRNDDTTELQAFLRAKTSTTAIALMGDRRAPAAALSELAVLLAVVIAIRRKSNTSRSTSSDMEEGRRGRS